jgi:hypothetical protein
VSDGWGTRRAAATLAALACALVLPAAGFAANPNVDLSAKGKAKFIFLKARVGSDGFVTPGQPETISITRMAPKADIAVFIEPPPTTLQCGELYFCDAAPAAPATGSPPFKADKKGRAVLTFITPATYNLETDPFNPKVRQPVAFADQQRIHIDVQGASKTRRVKRESFGFARATVQLARP